MSFVSPFDQGIIDLERRETETRVLIYGIEISIVRPASKALTTAGGYARINATPTTFPPKKRIVSSQGHEVQETEPNLGVGRRLRRYITGTYDDDIRVGDYFTNPVDGNTYTVQFVFEDRSVECKAQIEPIQ